MSEDIYLGETKCDLVNQDFLNYYDRYCQVEKSLNLPLTIPEGKQYLLIITDYKNDLSEVREDNNVEARSLTIKSDVISNVGDFYVSNSRLKTDKVLPDGYTRIYTDHSYAGTSATRQKVYVGYYLSTDTQLDTSDVLLGDDYSYLQASDLSDPEDARLTMPAETLPGDYHILVVSDYGEQFVEANKDNNIESVPLTVIPSDTEDFYLKDVKVQKTNFLVGEAIKPDSYLFYNGSSKSKLAIDVGYYLSKDRIFDSSDIKLGTRANTFSKYDYVEHETASSGVVNGELKTYNIPDDTLAGVYYILFVIDDNDAHVETNEDNNVESFTIQVTNNSTPVFSLDIDGDGEVKPLTDGLLNLRYQFGFRGDTLIDGAISPTASRKTADEIEIYLIEGGLALDIDGDGEIKPLTDGLLTLRYLFGFRGDTLINGAVGDSATRKTSGDIEMFLGSIIQ